MQKHKREFIETSVAIGVPHHGNQAPMWWVRMIENVHIMSRYGMRFAGILAERGVAIDNQRNSIVNWFLNKTDAEFLWFVDDDTVPPIGAPVKLASLNHPFTSGLYYSSWDDIQPIAYKRNSDGRYVRLDGVLDWEPGQIIQVDAAGAGCLLIHRSVFLGIMAKYERAYRVSGGNTVVLKDKIRGGLPETATKHPYAGIVKNGMLYEPLVAAKDSNDASFPFFRLEFGRTEDIAFFELAKAAGYPCYLDTGVECGHIKDSQITGDHFRIKQGALLEALEAQRKGEEDKES